MISCGTTCNRNGLQDTGEPGLANVRLELYYRNTSGSLSQLGDGYTGANGLYKFLNLTPGLQYRVRVYRPDGYVFTAIDAGADDSLDSDAGSAGSTAAPDGVVLFHNPEHESATPGP